MYSQKIIKKLLLISVILISGGRASDLSAGWFGPDNYKECIKHYLDEVENINAHTVMEYGCREKFVKKNKKFGQCHLDYLGKIKSSDAVLYLNVACVQLFHNEIKYDYKEIPKSISSAASKCMLKYVGKIIDVDSALFFSNVKCGAEISIQTTTTTN